MLVGEQTSEKNQQRIKIKDRRVTTKRTCRGTPRSKGNPSEAIPIAHPAALLNSVKKGEERKGGGGDREDVLAEGIVMGQRENIAEFVHKFMFDEEQKMGIAYTGKFRG